MSRKKRIVFISHDASLSGAPVLLANLVKLVNDSGKYRIDIVVKRGGETNYLFSSIRKTIFLKPANYLQGSSFLQKIFSAITNRIRTFQCLLLCYKADMIFSNTITNGRLLKILSVTNTPVVTYVHELAGAARVFDVHKDTSLSIQYSRCLLYPSSAVLKFLLEAYDLESKTTIFLPYFFPEKEQLGDLNKRGSKRAFAAKYNINEQNIFIVSMGTVSPRKGVDHFLETAELLLKKRKDISFIWIGDYEDAEIKAFVDGRLQQINSPDIIFTGKMPYDITNLLPFDIFFLSSREDPYPLVVLEAAYLGVPSICFKGSGGITDFVQEDTGWVINEFSPSLACEMLLAITSDNRQVEIKGKASREKVLTNHFNTVKILDIFEEVVTKATS